MSVWGQCVQCAEGQMALSECEENDERAPLRPRDSVCWWDAVSSMGKAGVGAANSIGVIS